MSIILNKLITFGQQGDGERVYILEHGLSLSEE